MMDDRILMAQYKARGMCCAQIIVQLGLDLRGEQNETMVQSVSALCGGVRKGLLCGALSGAALMLSLFDPKLAASEMIPELVDWFSDEFGSENCLEILDGDMANRTIKCGGLIEKTYFYAKGLLEDYGLLAE